MAFALRHKKILPWRMTHNKLIKDSAAIFYAQYILRRYQNAFASIREMLMQYSTGLPGSRVLADSYQTNLAGIAVAKERAGRPAYLTEFLDDMKQSGRVEQNTR
jgi:hypothetical protein